MSEGRAVALVGIATIVLGAAAWLVVVQLGGNGALATLAMFAVGAIGIDQMSRLGMKYDRR